MEVRREDRARIAADPMKPAWPIENCPAIPLMTLSDSATSDVARREHERAAAASCPAGRRADRDRGKQRAARGTPTSRRPPPPAPCERAGFLPYFTTRRYGGSSRLGRLGGTRPTRREHRGGRGLGVIRSARRRSGLSGFAAFCVVVELARPWRRLSADGTATRTGRFVALLLLRALGPRRDVVVPGVSSGHRVRPRLEDR